MNTAESKWKIWRPLQFLSEGTPVVLMVLNQPIKEEMMLIKQKWHSAVLRIAVDGGLIYLHEMNEGEQCYIPDIVCGDFDSLTQDILDFYAKMGAQIIHTPDQNETDFTKALRICNRTLLEKKLKADAILAIVRNSGRLDHILGNLNTLYTAVELSSVPLYLVGENTFTWLLEAGKHKIMISKQLMESHVGLIPLGEPCLNATTTGLKWNLSAHTRMEFGGLISACNRFDGSEYVTVENDQRLIWTMECKLDLEKK